MRFSFFELDVSYSSIPDNQDGIAPHLSGIDQVRDTYSVQILRFRMLMRVAPNPHQGVCEGSFQDDREETNRVTARDR